MADRKQNQRADDLREAAIGQDGRKNTSLQHNSTAKSTPFASRKRITTAAGLSFSETLAVMDEATELPPFGFNIAILEQRLERRLGFEVTKSAINECLMPYYNLREWQERYVMTALGTEVEDFPGKGSGNHPPISPLKEFDLRSDADKSEEDMEGQGGRRSGLATGASPTRERNPPRSGNASDHNGNNGGVDSCDMALD